MVLFSTDEEINRGKDSQVTSFVFSPKTLKTALNTVISSFLFLIAEFLITAVYNSSCFIVLSGMGFNPLGTRMEESW